MTETINNYFNQLWQNIWYYISFQFVDPWWWWLGFVVIAIILITLAEIAIRFYFADIPWLRKAGGLAIVGMILMLFSYSHGEKDARAHDKAANPPKAKPKENDQDWFGRRW